MSSPTAASWRAAWVRALDELELDVERAEAMLRTQGTQGIQGTQGTHGTLGGHDGRALVPSQVTADEHESLEWAVPSVDGPLPRDLAARAAGILQRQLRASEELGRAMSGNRRQAALTARLDSGGRRERPVFVDRAL